ncbi:kinase non-catalytic C-lobe domain-containing protein 1 isoform X2 [Takifugu flavidus]|uniref:kinase non-catalytic C-lobe domain-containing protein 1 isoform X2 n=1 Tax=Takifugu flavidus TaxID=433684 RepID=UPI0025446BCA|nr:kinase non-catalytic C-lobe domain-containing protein 1 isoform X2 [Takifugu flavidus]
METPERVAAVTFQGRAEERDDDLEHLPPLLEDEENVSLADILSLRDSCLSEQEVWAVCVECLQALQSIRPSHLFHTLCITPDTLAFNAHGNVCFMEQLSDDPEGSFVPPEFDNTGSTFEGHVYSLGSTLSAALTYIIEPELEAELGDEIQRLLQQMQEEAPEDRPLLQDVLALAEARLSDAPSAGVCRKLSSIGRRVLSIESVSAFQDGPEGSWEARWQHPKASLDSNPKDLCTGHPAKASGLSRQQVCRGWDSSLWAEDVHEGGVTIQAEDLDCRSHGGSPVRRRAQERQNRARGPLNRSCSVPDSNNPPCPPPHGDISVPVCDLTEIGAEEPSSCNSPWSSRRDMFNRGQSCDSYPLNNAEEAPPPGLDSGGNEDTAAAFWSGEPKTEAPRRSLPESASPKSDQSPPDHSLYVPNNHMTKSMLCLNEESQDEWISLGELLSRCGRRLTVDELWALCYTCLSSLQSYIDFPAYLCLETAHVGCEGDILFLQPKTTGFRDEFYLAPEYQEHGIVTEKACVYGVAAILWATAKFTLSPNQKLAVPRKLKRLLLEMAKRTAIERPSIVAAKKSCRDYLSHQGTNAETVWRSLIRGVHPAASRAAEEPRPAVAREERGDSSRGFLPTATESRLAPVPGPLPHSYSVRKEVRLPEAFTSTATHFSPIILTAEAEEGRRRLQDAAEGAADGSPEPARLTGDGSDSHPTRAETSPPTQQDVVRATSADATVLGSGCTVPEIPPPGCGVFNNYIFHQDPETGRLSLLPVLLRAAQSLPGLDIKPSLVPDLCLNDELPAWSCLKGSAVISDSREHSGEEEAAEPGWGLPSAQVHPALTEVIHLLKGEFSLDGYLDSGQEDVAMGEYIFSLKDLKYNLFARVVKERFANLYWEDDLLGVLHCLVNDSSAPLASDETPPPRGGPHDFLDLNGNVHVPVASSNKGAELQSCQGDADAAPEEPGRSLRGGQGCAAPSCGAGSAQTGPMDGGGGGGGESPSEPDSPVGTDGGLAGALYDRMSPDDCSADGGDGGSVLSDRLASAGAAPDGAGRGCGLSWALATFGEDWFGKDVIQYAENLGQHSAACLDVKTQELQQQLIIETRDLKKTRNFYQKLIHQERKSKGPESKSMLFKLKSQLEELRSRVAFLERVKEYLQILSVERWGLDLSVLPSLARCGPGSLDLQSSEDPSVLCFGAGRGKGSLQSGSPLGLMAYLYASRAALEGYIHQFLYTYRYFCTAEELLHFIMDKFTCAARRGPALSGEHEKVFHRSLDLLLIWVTDCRTVDFTPQPELVCTLENFLNAEVIPVDGRGEALLAALHTSARSPRSQRRESLSSFEEDDRPASLHSSTEDLGKKWRFSRVVEPPGTKEKAFSVAAALPMPSYGSLTDSILTNEEHLPFGQDEHSAHHIAQQLTLLQQEMFQEYHPVHFLNSRTQGVTDKISNHNKNVPPPTGGSSLPACEGFLTERSLQQLLTHADSVSNWISAEIIICDSVKQQAALLTKLLWVGKHCYESRNFATAMQVLCGLENPIVRQLPAWKHLSSKVCEILEELRAVQVFLKSDDLCLTREEGARKPRPTLPSVHILAMHVQQLEIGAFTLATGAYKWNKLRNIAKVASQVQAFQEAAFPYSPDRRLQAYLRRRIAQLAASTVHLLAPDGDSGPQQSSESQTRKIQEKLRRMKASFH